MKTQITSYYNSPEECPLKDDRLLTSDNADAWLEDDLYEVVSNEWDEERQEGILVVEVDLPEKSCRFLGHGDGSPPACYGFGNPELDGNPYYMEGVPNGFAPDLCCLHCAEYAAGREERRHDRMTQLNSYGVAELLPELEKAELGKYAIDPPFFYVDRATGKIAPSDDPLEQVLTASEAAQLWGLESSTVRRAAWEGRIPSRKSAGTVLVTVEDMIALYGPMPGVIPRAGAGFPGSPSGSQAR